MTVSALTDGPRPILVISDAQPGGDDLAAIAILLASRNVDVVGVMSTSGNLWGEETYDVLQAFSYNNKVKHFKVLRGDAAQRHRTRVRLFKSSTQETAFSGALSRPMPETMHSGEEAVNLILDTIERYAGAIDLVLLSPATLLSDAVLASPDITKMVHRVYMMGGAIEAQGNVTPYAEFNIWFDPESAANVFLYFPNVTLLPLDASNEHRYTGKTVRDINQQVYGNSYLEGKEIWDEALAEAIVSPHAVTRRALMRLDVVVEPGPFYGQTVPAFRDKSAHAVDVLFALDPGELQERLRSVLEK